VTVVDPTGYSGAGTGTAKVAAAPLQAKPVSFNPDKGLQYKGTVATFTGGDSTSSTTDDSATIDWGDGTSSPGSLASNPAGGFTVSGQKTYTKVGKFKVAATITDTAGDEAMANQTITVNAAPLSGNKVAIAAGAGDPFSGAVATFADSDPLDVITDYAAAIDWGDGTNSAGTTVSNSDGTYTVRGTKTYPTAGSFAVSVIITNTDGAKVIIHDTATVTGASVNASAKSFSATAGNPFSGVVATFTDTDPRSAVADFSATIDWGDGSNSGGTIGADPRGGYLVEATKTYTRAGGYPLKISITDRNGAQVAVNGSARVIVAPLWVFPLNVTAVPKKAFSGAVATLADGDPLDSVGAYTVVINWGDRTSSAGTVTFKPAGGFSVSGRHTYKKTGKFSVVVSITSTAGSSASIREVIKVAKRPAPSRPARARLALARQPIAVPAIRLPGGGRTAEW
jgi:hypothetical protein